ncbi:hypothetical protein UlMin_036723 [Ulmus minor]
MTPIVRYLTSDELPEDNNEAQRLRDKAARFTIHDGKLLKRSFSGPYLRCITPIEASHSTNKTVINIIKKRLEKAKGLWADELPSVLWAYRTTTKTSTGETPFSLAYGTEAVIPVECGIPSARYIWLNEDSNRELLNHSLDAIDDLRDKAHLHTAFYQQKVAQHYNKNIRVRLSR